MQSLLASANVYTLDELLGESSDLELIKTLITAAVLHPDIVFRIKCIEIFNETYQNILRRAYAEEGKIYACLRDREQRLYTFYINDLPKQYIPGQPVTAHLFNLDAN